MLPIPMKHQAPVPPPSYQRAQATQLNVSLAACFSLFDESAPPLTGWSSVVTQVALTYTATISVALAAWNAQRPDLIRSPKRVLAHLWEGDEL